MFTEAVRYREYLMIELNSIEQQLQHFSGGRLRCDRNGKSFKWFEEDPITKQRKYIPRSQRERAEKLAWRSFLVIRKREVDNEIAAVDAYLERHKRTGSGAEKFANKHEGYLELIEPFLRIKDENLNEWVKAPYDKLNRYQEQLIYKGIDGQFYRSKGEVLLANRFVERGIAFRYEDSFRMFDGEIVYPDFQIMHPITHEIIIWEHFGMMDRPTYRNINMLKLVKYAHSGYYINHNLIVTMEGDGMFLDMEEVDRIIDRILGM